MIVLFRRIAFDPKWIAVGVLVILPAFPGLMIAVLGLFEPAGAVLWATLLGLGIAVVFGFGGGAIIAGNCVIRTRKSVYEDNTWYSPDHLIGVSVGFPETGVIPGFAPVLITDDPRTATALSDEPVLTDKGEEIWSPMQYGCIPATGLRIICGTPNAAQRAKRRAMRLSRMLEAPFVPLPQKASEQDLRVLPLPGDPGADDV